VSDFVSGCRGEAFVYGYVGLEVLTLVTEEYGFLDYNAM
jgi:hypothetical protein